MILIDSSVWIDHFRNVESDAVQKLRHVDNPQEILVGDLILLEVLQGARNEHHARLIEQNLRQFPVVPMLGEALAIQAARNYRLLRERGITIRKTADLIIGTFCVEGRHSLLHDDRDFDPMAEHFGLMTL